MGTLKTTISYYRASAQLKELGAKVYEGELLREWNELFNR